MALERMMRRNGCTSGNCLLRLFKRPVIKVKSESLINPIEMTSILDVELLFIFRDASCNLAKTSFASFKKLIPAGVRETFLVERWSSLVSSSSSREWNRNCCNVRCSEYSAYIDRTR